MKEFKLSMQSLYEEIEKNFSNVLYFSAKDTARAACLKGFRLYAAGKELQPGFVYMTTSALLEEACPQKSEKELAENGFIVCGKTDITDFPFRCAVIAVEDADSFFQAINVIQELFALYLPWPQRLISALSSEAPLDAILEASLPIFRNPVFIHDPNFYILSCPHRAPGMLEWKRDPRTGRDIVPLNIIHEFKTQMEYLDTLSVTKPSIYFPESWDYRILYMNLWNGSHYEGRICVDELETPLKSADLIAIRYLAEFILESMHDQVQLWLHTNSGMERFFPDCLSGKIRDSSEIARNLYFLGWNMNDSYLVLRLEAERQDMRLISAGTLGHIETQIPYCHAMFFESGVSVVVNLTYSRLKPHDVISSLAILLREGLLKMGASSVLTDFMQLSYGHYQAKMALELGKRSQSMKWYHVFDDYLLEFLLSKAGEALPPELLCSRKLLALRQYDAENHTELFRTLKVFLELERNVLKTANTLFIHRSTLFYRLERIRKIADADLDDPKERLTLRLSFEILEKSLTGSTAQRPA